MSQFDSVALEAAKEVFNMMEREGFEPPYPRDKWPKSRQVSAVQVMITKALEAYYNVPEAEFAHLVKRRQLVSLLDKDSLIEICKCNKIGGKTPYLANVEHLRLVVLSAPWNKVRDDIWTRLLALTAGHYGIH